MSKIISIIIPVYNEGKNIPVVKDQILNIFQSLSYNYEIIFVNDGSNDNSQAVIEGYTKENKKIKCIEFSRNFGKEMAITAGLNYAKGDCAVIIDADLQHPVNTIPVFIASWEKGNEVVIGIRKKSKSDTLTKVLGSKLFNYIMSVISDVELAVNSTDFCLIDRKVIDAFNQCTERTRITRGLISWLGFKKSFVEFEANKRLNGQASYSTLKLFKLALSSFVAMSLFPLKIAGYLGLLITSVSGLLLVLILIEKIVFSDPWGFTWLAFLVVSILFLVGVVLSCLGLIALYIGSILLEVSGRPLYIIRSKDI